MVGKASDMAGVGDRRLPWWRRWRTALLASLVAILAVHAVREAIVAVRAHEQAERAALTRHVELAEALADAVDLFVARYTSLAESTVGPLLETGMSAERRRAQVERLARRNPEVGIVATVGPDGRVLESADPRAVGLDLTHRDYFLRLRDGARATVSDLVRGALNGRPSIPVGAAARDPRGRFLGAFVIGLPNERLMERVRIQLTGGAYPVVLDRAGRAVIHGARPGLDWDARDLSAMPLVREAEAGRPASAARTTDPVTGETVMGAMVPVPSLGWVVGVLQPRDAVLASARDQVRESVTLTLAILAGGLVLALLLARWLASPLAALAGGVSALASGNLAHRVPVRWRNEFGLLAARFNEMAERTERTVGDLTAAIAERERTEEALRTTTSLLEAVVEASPLAIMAFDPEGRVTLWNGAAERTFGFTAEEVLGGPAPMIDETRRDDFLRNVRRILAGEVFAGVESRRRRKDGTTFEVQIWSAPLEEPDGRVTGVLSIVADVSEQKRAREGQHLLVEAGAALAASLDLHSTLATLAAVTVPRLADACIIDLLRPDGTLECVAVAHPDPAKADAVREMRRRFPPDPAGPHPAAVAVRTGRAQLLSEFREADMRALAASEEHLAFVQRLAARSVAAVPLVARSRVLGALQLVTDAGRSLAASDVAVLEEIAGRAALAIENARLYQEAQAAVHARDAFLARAAHELRTPLTSALGTVRWLKRARPVALGESPDELIEIADRNLAAMMALVNDLLDASKLASGRDSLSLATVGLADLARRSADVLRAQARAAGVRLDVRVPDALGVPADPLKLEQVLVNLLANAVKFTPGGGQVVVEAARQGTDAVIHVRDTGEGIAAEHLEAIFEPFYQATRARADRRRGTGLGLAICRQIVGLHGGRITADSEGPGRGSVFTVVLPGATLGEHAA